MRRTLFVVNFVSVCAILSATATAQVAPIHTEGTVEQFFTNGRNFGENTTRDAFTRAQLAFDSGNWRLTGTYWYFPSYGWYDLDETTLEYSDSHQRARIGRFIPPIGLANWDEQWYSGFVYQPNIEAYIFTNRWLTLRTSPGLDYETHWGNDQIRIAWFGSDANYRRLFAKNLDRAAVRYQTNYRGLIAGLTYESDLSDNGKDEHLKALDLQWTAPHWILRGEVLGYSSDYGNVNGYFVDVSHRPQGWQDVTLLLRLEDFHATGANARRAQLVTPGVKVRLPFDIGLDVNYNEGPGMRSTPWGGGWALALYRTFRF